MKVAEEMLMAYVDGELDPIAAARVEAAMADDPELAAAVARERALRRRLRSAFGPIAEKPVPERLIAAARGETSRSRRTPGTAGSSRRRTAWRYGGAMAAGILIGVLFVRALPDRSGGEWRSGADGALLADGSLAQALDEQLASAPAAGAAAIGLSFKDKRGEYCRTFTTTSPRAQAGLACRGSRGWYVSLLMEAPASPAGEIRTASTTLPPALLGEVDARIQGEPLDAAAERSAREAGWR